MHDGIEKFYNYIEWIKYLNEHFFKPWGIVLSGTVEWQGEKSGDAGSIKIEDGSIMWQAYKRVEGEWTFA